MRVQPLAAKQRVAVGPDGICPIDDQFQRKGKPYALGREVHLRFSLDVVESLAFDEILHERHVEQQQDEENDRHEDRDDFQRIFQNLSNHDRRLTGRHRTAEGHANFQAKVTLFHRFLQSVLHGVRKRLPPYVPRLKKLRTNSNRKSSLSVKKSLLLQKIERFMPIKSEVAQLLLHCPDKPGILAEVTDFITVNKGNIVYLDQYVDHAENVFFMRIAWELDGFLIPKEKIEDYFQTLYGRKYQMIFRLYFSDVKPRMAVFVSRMSHCLYDMLARYTAGEWNAPLPCGLRAGRENHRRHEPLRDHRAGCRTDHRAGNRPDYAQGHDRGSGQQGKGSGKDRAVESRPKAHRAKGTGVQKQDGHFQLTTVTARDGIA